jgi:cell division septation protein DedD
MSEEALTDDQSHYEVSLTAGQAFLAFVLLLLSLAASFAFGLMIGKGQGDPLLARKEAAVVNETPSTPKKEKEVVAVQQEDFEDTEAPAAVIKEEQEPAPPIAAAKVEKKPAAPVVAAATPAAPAVPHYAQLFSTSDQKNAERMAAALIDGGFSSAYVERSTNDKGAVYRVRVKFPSESAARAAEPRLRSFSKEVWITKG